MRANPSSQAVARQASCVALLALAVVVSACGRKPQDSPVPPAPAALPAPPAAEQSSVAPGAPAAAGANTQAARWPFLAGGAETASAVAQDARAMLKRNYYVVMDASGSMSETRCSGDERKIAVALRALGGFIDSLPADVNLGLMTFDNAGIRELMPLTPLDKGAAARAVSQITVGGGTPLKLSIRRAYEALTRQAQLQSGYGEFHMVVVTDGEATGGSPAGTVNAMLQESPVVLHTIGFCIGEQHSLNQAGRVVYRAADNAQALQAGLSDVLAESPTFAVQTFK